ncbi:MAG: hypothetical protein E7597_04595 [Ruminococcaceae bacterium]|nr:hypothetical protein [Oscillospiraceae bacterium]
MLKRFSCMMFCLYWLISVCAFHTIAADFSSIKTNVDFNCGDVNADGETNSLDAALVLKHDSGIATLDINAVEIADVNCDGVANSLDAALILKYDAKIITDFMAHPIPDNSISVEESFTGVSSEADIDESKKEEQQMYDYCALMVNGKEITEGAAFDSEISLFRLPLLVISKELGINVEWISDTEVVLSNGTNTLTINTKEPNFGVTPPNPPYDIGVYIREIVGEEIIMDVVSAIWIINEFEDINVYLDTVSPLVSISAS